MIKATLQTYPSGRKMIEIDGLSGTHAMEPESAAELAFSIIFALPKDNVAKTGRDLYNEYVGKAYPNDPNSSFQNFLLCKIDWYEILYEHARTWREFTQERFNDFAKNVMVESIIGLADAAIVTNQNFTEEHALRAVRELAVECKRLRALLEDK